MTKEKMPEREWEEVLYLDGKYWWRDGARGRHEKGYVYIQALMPLTPEELSQYKMWKKKLKK